MRIFKARAQGYRSVSDSGFFDIENDKTILVGPNEAGKTAILKALAHLNRTEGVEPFNPLRDYPRSLYSIDIDNRGMDLKQFVVVEGHFYFEDKEGIPEDFFNIKVVKKVFLDNHDEFEFLDCPSPIVFNNIEEDLLWILAAFQNTCKQSDCTSEELDQIKKSFEGITNTLENETIVSPTIALQLISWLKSNIQFLKEDNETEKQRFDKLLKTLETPTLLEKVHKTLVDKIPKFVLFSNYFRIRPSIHLEKLATRIEQHSLDENQYDYGNLCLLKLLGFTARELSDLGNVTRYNNGSDNSRVIAEQLDRQRKIWIIRLKRDHNIWECFLQYLIVVILTCP